MSTTVSSKGQITIPKRLRERLGIQPGTQLELRERDGQLIATKLTAGDPVGDVFGSLADDLAIPQARDTDAIIVALRGEEQP